MGLGAFALTGVVLVAATAGAVDIPDAGDDIVQATVVVGDAPTVLFTGDSVALSVVAPVVQDPGRYGINPLNAARPGCAQVTIGRRAQTAFGTDFEPPPCASAPTLEGRPLPDAVFVYVGARPNDYIDIDGEWIRACDPRFDRAYRDAMVALLDEVTGGDARPSVVATIPPSGQSSIPVEGSEERIACVDAQLAEVVERTPNAHLLVMADLVCPDGPPCVEAIGGDPIRSDGLHYDAGPGGARVADWIVEQIAALTGITLKPAGLGTPADGAGLRRTLPAEARFARRLRLALTAGASRAAAGPTGPIRSAPWGHRRTGPGCAGPCPPKLASLAGSSWR